MDLDAISVEVPPQAEAGFHRKSAEPSLNGGRAMDISRLPGRLIVLEGTDGAGRSTHIALLREWLESRGFAVALTALRRSKLAGEGLQTRQGGAHARAHQHGPFFMRRTLPTGSKTTSCRRCTRASWC